MRGSRLPLVAQCMIVLLVVLPVNCVVGLVSTDPVLNAVSWGISGVGLLVSIALWFYSTRRPKDGER